MTAIEVKRATDYVLLPSLMNCARHGYWFCTRCQRVVNLGLDNSEPCRCPKCKHKTATWHPPVI